MEHLAVEPENKRRDSATERDSVPRDGVEDRLGIRRRTRDDAQDLARRRLLLQGLGHLGMGVGQRAVLLLQLGEQPRVLNGDHGLISEGLEEGDLFVREQAERRPADEDRSDRDAVAPQRDADDATKPGQMCKTKTFWWKRAVSLDVGQVNNSVLKNGSTRHERRSHWCWIGSRHLRNMGMLMLNSNQINEVVLAAIHGR